MLWLNAGQSAEARRDAEQTAYLVKQAVEDVLQYYLDIDAGRIKAVMKRFAENAIYRRGEEQPITGHSEIKHFFQELHKLRGRHSVQNYSGIDRGDCNQVFVTGTFFGTYEGEPVEILFTDLWIYNDDGKVTYRESTLTPAS